MSQNHDELDQLKEASDKWTMDDERKSQMKQSIRTYAVKTQKRKKRQRWMVASSSVAAALLFAFITIGLINEDSGYEEASREANEEQDVNMSPEEIVSQANVSGEQGNYRITGSVGEANESFEYKIISEEGELLSGSPEISDGDYSIDVTIPDEELPTSGDVMWEATIDGESATTVIDQIDTESNESLSVDVTSVDQGTIMIEGMEQQTEISTFEMSPYGIMYQLEEAYAYYEVGDNVITHHNDVDDVDVTIDLRVMRNISNDEALSELGIDPSQFEGEEDLSQYDTVLDGTHYYNSGEGYVISDLGDHTFVIDYELTVSAGDGFWPRFEQLLETIELES